MVKSCVCVYWTVPELIYISGCISLELAITLEKLMAKYDILHKNYTGAVIKDSY